MKNLWSYLLLILILGVFVVVAQPWAEPSGYSGLITGLVIFVGLVLLCLFGLILWNYIHYQPHKNPFRDGPISHFIHRKKRIKYNEIATILTENDPERFLLETDAFLKEENLPKGLTRIASDNRAVAYLQAGRTKQALAIWEQAAKDEEKLREIHKHKDEEVKAIIHHNLCIAYLENNQLVHARKHYDIVTEMQNSKHLGKGLKAWFQEEFLDIDAMFLLAEEQYETARVAYQKLLQEGEPAKMFGRHFDLANIYEKLGDTEKQKEHLEQVVALGNKHYKAKIAQDKLAELN